MAIMVQMATKKSVVSANLIEELLKWSGVQQTQNILDVGCGIGGYLYTSREIKCATGITLSQFKLLKSNWRAAALELAARTVSGSRCSSYAVC